MEEKTLYRDDTYFAASNGYGGFKSYFSEIFESSEFARIYVLKGGPGTGKSTLMRKVKSAFSGVASTDSILCSSDISSLDGVIIERNGVRCAVIDGTAPHERDAVIPGAVDEIGNLGQGWSGAALTAMRNEILDLCGKKKRYYALAYRMLALAGGVNACVRDVVALYIRKATVDALVNEIFESVTDRDEKRAKPRLYSCFGKHGYQRLPLNYRQVKKIRKGHASPYLMSALKERYAALGGVDFLFPSPLDPSSLEGFCVGDIAFIEDDGPNATDCSCAVDSKSIADRALIEEFEATKAKHLSAAKQYFDLASQEHFKLEKIYSESMDFSANASASEKIIDDFSKILKI